MYVVTSVAFFVVFSLSALRIATERAGGRPRRSTHPSTPPSTPRPLHAGRAPQPTPELPEDAVPEQPEPDAIVETERLQHHARGRWSWKLRHRSKT